MARDFDGTDDELRVPDAASLDLNDWSIACWAYFDALDADRNLISKRDNAGSTINYALNHSATNMQVFYTPSVGNFRVLTVPLSGNFVTGTWYHLIGTATTSGGNTDLRLFKNGALLGGPTNFSGVPQAITAYLSLGHNQGVEFLNGRMAQVCIWNRALSANEANAVYRGGPLVAPSGLVAYLELFGYGTQEPDWSGSGNHATTITGTMVIDHPPLRPPFGFDRGWMGAFTAIAGAAAVPYQPWTQRAPVLAQ